MAHSVAIEESSSETTVSEAVVSAVAEVTGSDPLSLDPLYTVVDPDALNSLFDGDSSNRERTNRVEFTYCDCDVVVTDDGDVRASSTGRKQARVDASG